MSRSVPHLAFAVLSCPPTSPPTTTTGLVLLEWLTREGYKATSRYFVGA
ncbi:MAG: hypothetical protein U0183_14235 [Polyangiaceae bacterium]